MMIRLCEMLPPEWQNAIAPFYDLNQLDAIQKRLDDEIQAGQVVFPPENKIFAALQALCPDQVKAVILGQDPYHDDGQACGFAFAVPDTVPPPPSLKNILKEYSTDLALEPTTCDISAWNQHGVLLLNTVLTVRAHHAASHRNIMGWEPFTNAVIQALNARPTPVAFILWGADAQKKKTLITSDIHPVLCTPHPSPLSSYRGFFGSRPFSTVNTMLAEKNAPPVDWRLNGAGQPMFEF